MVIGEVPSQERAVIGVDVANESRFVSEVNEIEEKSVLWLARKGRREAPSILRILTRSAMINGDAQTVESRAAADLLIRPDVATIPMLSFKAFDKAIEAGYRAGTAALPQLKALTASASGR